MKSVQPTLNKKNLPCYSVTPRSISLSLLANLAVAGDIANKADTRFKLVARPNQCPGAGLQDTRVRVGLVAVDEERRGKAEFMHDLEKH